MCDRYLFLNNKLPQNVMIESNAHYYLLGAMGELGDSQFCLH